MESNSLEINTLHFEGAADRSPREHLPHWSGALLFRFKAWCFQLRRLWQDFRRGGVPHHETGEMLRYQPIWGEWRSELWRDSASSSEWGLQLGKVQNLRLAAHALDGLEIPAGQLFSFWRQIGRTSRRRGFATGRELREGCIIPTIGGGLCQISGALYNAALQAGLEIVERHAHSHPAVGSLARLGRDATIFWNYVDLRFRHDRPWRIEAKVTRDHLEVRIRVAGTRSGDRRPAPPIELVQPPREPASEPNACVSCGIESCFRHSQSTTREVACLRGNRQAVLVDEWWPEWQAYLDGGDYGEALLCRPLDGRRFRKQNYQWNGAPFGETKSAILVALRRAWAVRGLREQGAARQQALLEWDRRLALAFARRLRPEHTHLVISQNLLPHLWLEGVLGGRTFDVLMVRLPMAELHCALDQAASLHPESATCSDFRAPGALVRAEAEALASADRWITPHSGIARLGGLRSLRVPWVIQRRSSQARASAKRIVFPASTLCRKGAYELREAARALNLEVTCLGRDLEGADFWSGIRTAAPDDRHWLKDVAAVVLPAFVEHRPRRLLQAIEAGIPVIASEACGLGGVAGVVEMEAGDVGELIEALRRVREGEIRA